jgi:predicted lipoprotein with Yx(FWY)xxD motif
MDKTVGIWSLAACVALAGCAGGSASSFSPAPSFRPVATSVLSTATVGGGPAFIDATMHVVYVFDGDMNTPNFSNCTSGDCVNFWPSLAVAPGVMLPMQWSVFVRPGGALQLAYKGRAMYTFSGDTSALVSAGDSLNEFGGFWHIARP